MSDECQRASNDERSSENTFAKGITNLEYKEYHLFFNRRISFKDLRKKEQAVFLDEWPRRLITRKQEALFQ